MSSFLLKRGLLTFQFFVTVFLVFSIYVLRLQVNEMVNFDPGYNSEDVFSMVISRNKPLNANRAVIEQEVQALPGVTMTVGGTFPFNMNGSRRMKLYREDSLLQSRVPIANITPGFFRTMQIDLLQGQSMEQLTDIPYEQACIVNEEFVEAYGLEVPIGLRLELNGQPKTIVGVCRDFSVWGVNNPKPMSQVFLVNETKYTSLLVKTDGSNRQETLASLNEIWRKYNPILSPSVHVLEEQNALKIASFTKLYKLFSLLAFMVVALSMMNLFGTALIFANAKIKNISIRKILGARTAELFGRLSSPFLINLLIGLSMAIPLGYLAMQQYLERYAVRISLNLWQALSVTVLMVVLVYLVIGYKMLRFSQTDPVKALKEE